MRYLATLVFLIFSIMVYGLLTQLNWPLHTLLYIPLTSVLAFIVVFVHEFGHALAARLYKRPLLAFVALPFEWRFRPLRMSFADPSLRGSDIGGYVHYAVNRPQTRREAALIAFAGPAANFLLAGFAILLASWLATRAGAPPLPRIIPDAVMAPGVHNSTAAPPWAMLPPDEVVARVAAMDKYLHSRSAAAIIAEALGALSIGAGIANLIPFKDSDGDHIISALFRGRSRA